VGHPDTAATEEWNANFAYGVWATGGDMNTARNNLGGAGNGTQTAALAFGGFAPSVPDCICFNRINMEWNKLGLKSMI
jgi:hypothetical protein